jgi:hypothetical protein
MDELFAGIDYGGDETKAVIWDPARRRRVYPPPGPTQIAPPGLRGKDPSDWAQLIHDWIAQTCSGGVARPWDLPGSANHPRQDVRQDS